MYLGRLLDIPVHVHISVVAVWAAFMGWCVWTMGTNGVMAGLILSVGIFSSVLLHEFGHALAAKAYGIGTAHITLYPFGGLAALEKEADSAREEFIIAGAGPAMNGVLFLLFGGMYIALSWRFLLVFSAMNLLMMAYNLLPAFPMDGGRMLRAGLSARMGWFKASKRALQLGSVFAWGSLAFGLVMGSITTALTGAMLLYAVHTERKRLAWMWAYDRDQAGYKR